MKISNLTGILLMVMTINVSQASDLHERDAYKRPEGIPSPPANPLTVDKAALGKTLFFDSRLSRNQDMSCATCHAPDKRWSDGRKIALGAEEVSNARRTPTVLNSAWLTTLMWDGRANSLESQAVLPITTAHEMNYDLTELVTRLQKIAGYGPLFAKAYGDDAVNEQRITKALASFQRTLVSENAPFDAWVAGDETAISDAAKNGFLLFNDKAQCAACHKTWRFTDDSFHDIGLPTDDLGRGAILPVQVTIMQHAFKTPSLRDLPENGPFMHNGSMQTLEEVIKHYEDGGIQRASLSPEMKGFELTEAERQQLIAFLETLVGPPLKIDIPEMPQ